MDALVLSPHFDDAVLSCAGWLEANPGASVATVCSGNPGTGVPADPAWDALAGFTDGGHAAAARRIEDREALAILGARQLVLGFLDGAYKTVAGRPHEDPAVDAPFGLALERSVGALLDELRPDVCLFPLGLVHPDHRVTRRAALVALEGRPGIDAVGYLDLPYGLAFTEAAREQLDRVAPHGVEVVAAPAPTAARSARKRRAAGCYRSQLPLLEESFGERLAESLHPGSERLFRVRR